GVVVKSTSECNTMYSAAPLIFGTIFPRGLDATTLCAGGGLNMDVCRGDSGGPLVLREGVEKEQEIGIVSAGIGCGDPNFPGIYTRTDAYINWLDESIYGACASTSFQK
ncbi:unnamed protein product, partial [Meganyctiphanes norvegica]